MTETSTGLEGKFEHLETTLKDLAKPMGAIMFGIIIVLFVSLVAILITVIGFTLDSFRFKAATYEELKSEVLKQNSKIDTLIHELEIQRMVSNSAGY